MKRLIKYLACLLAIVVLVATVFIIFKLNKKFPDEIVYDEYMQAFSRLLSVTEQTVNTTTNPVMPIFRGWLLICWYMTDIYTWRSLNLKYLLAKMAK